jgi:hypothetical protein
MEPGWLSIVTAVGAEGATTAPVLLGLAETSAEGALAPATLVATRT